MFIYLFFIYWQVINGKYYFIVFRYMYIFLELSDILEFIYFNYFFIQLRKFDNIIYFIYLFFIKSWKEDFLN